MSTDDYNKVSEKLKQTTSLLNKEQNKENKEETKDEIPSKTQKFPQY